MYFTSSSNVVYIKFLSDAVATHPGYTLKYWCTDTYTAISGSIYDTGGSGSSYGNNENTFQLVKCADTMFASVSFTQLAVDGVHPSCSTDRINVASMLPVTASQGLLYSLMYTGCGTPTVQSSLWKGISPSNMMLINFVSNSAVVKGGNAISYRCLPYSNLYSSDLLISVSCQQRLVD